MWLMKLFLYNIIYVFMRVYIVRNQQNKKYVHGMRLNT